MGVGTSHCCLCRAQRGESGHWLLEYSAEASDCTRLYAAQHEFAGSAPKFLVPIPALFERSDVERCHGYLQQHNEPELLCDFRGGQQTRVRRKPVEVGPVHCACLQFNSVSSEELQRSVSRHELRVWDVYSALICNRTGAA